MRLRKTKREGRRKEGEQRGGKRRGARREKRVIHMDHMDQISRSIWKQYKMEVYWGALLTSGWHLEP